jgi:tRNA(fMet)-specific endonuclease VapC
MARRASSRLSAQLEAILAVLEVAAFEAPADEIYGRIRAHLEQQGCIIGSNGLLIAAQALAADATLVSGNEREFARVPGLKLENWLGETHRS